MSTPFIDKGIFRLHRLIETKSTGTPDQLACRLGCSRRTVFNKIEQLRESGLPVAWCTSRQSYYYTAEVTIHFSLVMDGKEMQRIGRWTG